MKYNLTNPFKLECAENDFLALKNKQAFIELREIKLKRSLDANGLYWLWLTCIQSENGINKDDCHLLYRATFLQKDEDHIIKIIRPELWLKIKSMIADFNYFDGLNEIIDVISYSTTKQDSLQFKNYLDRIRAHARANMNIILLTLEDKNFKEFYREYGFR